MFEIFDKEDIDTLRENKIKIVGMDVVEAEAKKLERINSYIENTQDPDLKEILIKKADMLNEEVAELEICCGLDEDEIMEKYSKMSKTPEVANEIVKGAVTTNPEKFSGVKNFNELVDVFGKVLSPKSLSTLVAALVILVATEGRAQVYENMLEEIAQSNEAHNISGNAREGNLAESLSGAETGETSKKRIKEGNLKIIKIIGKKMYARQPAGIIMSSREGFPEDVSLILSKLRSSGDYLSKDFIELLGENAENFAPGELEKIERYLINRFEK